MRYGLLPVGARRISRFRRFMPVSFSGFYLPIQFGRVGIETSCSSVKSIKVSLGTLT